MSEYHAEYYVPIVMDSVADLMIAAGAFEALAPGARVGTTEQGLAIVRATTEHGPVVVRPSPADYPVLYEFADLSARKQLVNSASQLEGVLELCLLADQLPKHQR